MINNVTRYIDLNNEKFRIKPKPQEDELLSSWLVRVARAHLTLTTSFTNMHFKEYKNNIIWQRDLDIWCPDKLIDRISFKSGYSQEIIFNMTLRSLEGIITDKITGKSNTPNIRALGNYGSCKRYVFSYLGKNSRIDEIQAAVLSTKLPYLDEENENGYNIVTSL